MHPLAGDLESLKDIDLENKINDLTKKYFMTRNPGLQAQDCQCRCRTVFLSSI